MSSIRTMCPHCISAVDLNPTEVLLLAASSAPGTGSYAYSCRTCERVTVAAVSEAAFTLLLTAGVKAESYDPEPRPATPAHGFTADALIDFHRLLDTQDWFTRLLRQS